MKDKKDFQTEFELGRIHITLPMYKALLEAYEKNKNKKKYTFLTWNTTSTYMEYFIEHYKTKFPI